MNPSASHRSAGGTLFIIAILPAFNLIGQKETLVCNGKIYSETHKQKFEVREATFKIDKNLANDSKLTFARFSGWMFCNVTNALSALVSM